MTISALCEALFWFSVIFVGYTYFGYVLILFLLGKLRGYFVEKDDITPSVSFIITAYNEEKILKKKIENTVEQDYPKDKIEIIVASDCSTDRTDEIAKSFEAQGVRLIRAPQRKGKENTQKYAVDEAHGDILVFSDAATLLEPTGVRCIVKSFNDPAIGCVSSMDRFIDKENNLSGEGIYVKYEMMLRRLESRANGLVGLSGSFFAARREVCSPWAVDLQSDFNTLMNAVRKGYRGACDADAIGYYRDLAEDVQEFHRKVRTVVRGIRVFMRNLSMLNPGKYGLFSWQLMSHKLCRWLVPFALIMAVISSAYLAFHSVFYLSVFLLQCIFYVLACVGVYIQTNHKAFRVLRFFVTVNASVLYAWFSFIKGKKYVHWEPSTR